MKQPTKMPLRIFTAFFGLSGLVSCATQQAAGPRQVESPIVRPSQAQMLPKKHINKPGSKEEGRQSAADTQKGSSEIKYLELLDPAYQLKQEDLNFVFELDSHAESLDEALSVLISLRYLMSRSEETPGYVARDLTHRFTEDETEAREESKARSLQSEAQEIGVRFAIWTALAQNPFLQLPDIYSLVDQVLDKIGNSPRDRQELSRLTELRKNSWASLLPPEETKQEDSQEVRPKTESTSPAPETQRLDRYSLADLNRGDALLRQAQSYADRGDYKQAIQFATRINRRDPMFPAAEEKVKDFSNSAVQDLRQKAAQAFQSALPVSDRETKLAYLEQARQYLVQALENFPEADHLSTVRENLAVISQDLESLSGERVD